MLLPQNRKNDVVLLCRFTALIHFLLCQSAVIIIRNEFETT